MEDLEQEINNSTENAKSVETGLNEEMIGPNAKDNGLNDKMIGLNAKDNGLSEEMIGPNAKDNGLNEEMIGLNAKDNGLNEEMIGPNAKDNGLNVDKSDVENRDEVKEQLKEISEPARNQARMNYAEMESIILRLCAEQYLTIKELAELLNRDAGGLRKRYITPLLREDKLELLYPKAPRHKKQAYRTKS